jgi:hypothetical protein
LFTSGVCISFGRRARRGLVGVGWARMGSNDVKVAVKQQNKMFFLDGFLLLLIKYLHL